MIKNLINNLSIITLAASLAGISGLHAMNRQNLNNSLMPPKPFLPKVFYFSNEKLNAYYTCNKSTITAAAKIIPAAGRIEHDPRFVIALKKENGHVEFAKDGLKLYLELKARYEEQEKLKAYYEEQKKPKSKL